MANVEIQHVRIALKPEHQWRRRGNRRCICYGRLGGASPIRDAEFAVGGFLDATDGDEFVSPLRGGGIDRSPVWNSGDMHSLGGGAGLPESRGSRTDHRCKQNYNGERLFHCCEFETAANVS